MANYNRIKYALKILNEHNIEHYLINETTGEIHRFTKNTDSLIVYYANTGTIKGSNAKGIYNLCRICTQR